uniref:Splicing factor YJU2 n=1 Tax=Hippocampus comes TaxID=109280 RepID=A0A3Q3DI14_HIPCM
MSERKVLNKYYPPDFDPAKIPKLKLPKDRQYVVRLMAPFNMRCKTCGEYIYKGKKFNARKETVQNQLYMGLPIFRFYIKCTRCLAEITFKVSSSRNVTDCGKRFLKDVTDFEGMLGQYRELEKREREREKEEDERETKDMLERALVKRLRDSDSDNEEDGGSNSRDVSSEKSSNADNPTDILTAGAVAPTHVHGLPVFIQKENKYKKSPPVSGTANLSTPCTAAPNGSSSLSLLGAYSDSESSDSE